MPERVIIPPLSSLWLISIGISALLILAFILSGKRMNERQERLFRYILAGLILGRLVVFQAYLVGTGRWDFASSLPLHLCGVSSILAAIQFVKPKESLFEFLLLLGFPGAIHALITPELDYELSAGFVFEFYFSHSGIILAALYFFFVHGARVRKGSWLPAFLTGQVLLLGIAIFNWLFGANYMFLSSPPIVDNPMVIGTWPWYIIGFEVLGFLHIIFFYYLFSRGSMAQSQSETY